MNPRNAYKMALPAALLLAACGGLQADQEFEDAAPDYSLISMDMTQEEATPPASIRADGDLAQSTDALTLPAGDDCHPHLFARTHEVVQRVNRHIYKGLVHFGRIMRNRPRSRTATTHTWFKSENGIDKQLTITKIEPKHFSWKLEMKKTGDANYLAIVTGEIDKSEAQGPRQGKGDLTINLDNLKAVKAERDVAGVITLSFEGDASTRKIIADAKDVVWDRPDLRDPEVQAALSAPQSGRYVYFRQPGTGGSLKFTDQMFFRCPEQTSPPKAADVKTIARWYKLADGSVNGRADALMENGQLATGNTVQGVTCFTGRNEASVPNEGYWMMKLEDANKATLAFQTVDSGAGAAACDPKLGEVPDTGGAGKDFDFAAINYTDDQPYPVPQ